MAEGNTFGIFKPKEANKAQASYDEFFKELAATLGLNGQPTQQYNFVDPVDRYKLENPLGSAAKQIKYESGYKSPDLKGIFKSNVGSIADGQRPDIPIDMAKSGQQAKTQPPTPDVGWKQGRTDAELQEERLKKELGGAYGDPRKAVQYYTGDGKKMAGLSNEAKQYIAAQTRSGLEGYKFSPSQIESKIKQMKKENPYLS